MAKVEEIILKVRLDDKKLNMQLKSISSSLDHLNKKFKDLGSGASFELNKVTGHSTKLGSALKGTADNADKAAKKVKKVNKETGLLDKSLGRLGQQVVAAFAVSRLIAFGKEAINISRQFERIELSMKTIFGSSGAQQIEFVRQEAQRLGIDTLLAADGFAKLAASTKGVLTLKQTKDIFSATADASAALGLSAHDTSSILRALTQIASKGKVSTEELLQIAERMPGTFKLAADSMGLTTQELMKFLEQGKVASKDFLPKFAEELRKTFHEGAMKNATSEIAESTRNMNRWNDILDNTPVTIDFTP